MGCCQICRKVKDCARICKQAADCGDEDFRKPCTASNCAEYDEVEFTEDGRPIATKATIP